MSSDEQEPDPPASPPLSEPNPPTPVPANTLATRLRVFLRSYWTPAGKQALRNLIGLVVCTGFSQVCAVGILLMLTHGLSQTKFGAVIFAVNVQVYLVTVGTFGLATIVVRDLTQDPNRADHTRTAFLIIVVVASASTGLVVALLAAVLPLSGDERLMLWCVAVGNVAACLNLNPLFDAAHRQALAAALMLPGDLLAVSLIGWLYWTDELTVAGVGVVFLARWVLTAALHLVVYNQAIQRFRRACDRHRIGALLRSGRPMMLGTVVFLIPMGGSVVLVRLLSGEELTAIYGLAFQIVAIELLVVILLLRVLQPYISGPYGLTTRFLRQLAVVVGTLVGLLVAATLVGGWFLIYHLLPADYQDTFGVLSVLQVSVVCFTLATVVNYYLLRFHREWWVQTQHVLATAVYLTLIFSVGRHFAIGFAVCTVVASGVFVIVGLVGLAGRPACNSTDHPSLGKNT